MSQKKRNIIEPDIDGKEISISSSYIAQAQLAANFSDDRTDD